MKYRQIKYLFIVVLFAIALFTTACNRTPENTAGSSFYIEDAWVRAMPPGSKMTAAYGILINRGDSVLRVNKFSSPQYSSVSLHETIIDRSGMSKMQALHELVLQPGEKVVLEPGGKHFMLMEKHAFPDSVGPITVNIRFELEKPLSVEFVVK